MEESGALNTLNEGQEINHKQSVISEDSDDIVEKSENTDNVVVLSLVNNNTNDIEETDEEISILEVSDITLETDTEEFSRWDVETPGSVFIGERLTAGLMLDDVQKKLNIRKSYLEAFEEDRLDSIEMPELYIIANLRAYCKFLHLDEEEILTGYRHIGQLSPPKEKAFHNLKSQNGALKKTHGLQNQKHLNSSLNLVHKKKSKYFLAEALSISGLVAPVAIGVGVLALIGFGVSFLLSGVQELEVAPVTVLPQVESNVPIIVENDQATPTNSNIDLSAVYERADDLSVSFANRDNRMIEIVNTSEGELQSNVSGVAPTATDASEFVIDAPRLELLPMGEAWVQLKSPTGEKLFEQILKPGEAYTINLDTGIIPILKAGNATQLFVRLSGEVYGPLSNNGSSVVRNIVLDDAVLAQTLSMAEPLAVEDLRNIELSYLENNKPDDIQNLEESDLNSNVAIETPATSE